MNYEINKNLWQPCRLCQEKISSINKKYGGNGKYATDNFEKHLSIEHKSNLEDYFQAFTVRPICKCDICKQQTNIQKKGSNFVWRTMKCGRNEGIKEWSEKAKITRKGEGNPMYEKEAWNKGLTIYTSEILKKTGEKRKGITFSDYHKKKCLMQLK